MRSLWQTRIQPLYQRSILVRSGLWYLIGESITKALSFGGILVYTNILTEAQFGTAAIFLTWTSMMYIIATLNLEATMARAYFDYEGDARAQYASAAYILGLPLVYTLIIAVMLLPAALILDLTGLEQGLFLLVLVALPFRLGVHMVLRYQEAAQQYQSSVWLSFWVEVAEFALCVVLMVIPPRLFPAYPPEYGRILIPQHSNQWLNGTFILKDSQRPDSHLAHFGLQVFEHLNQWLYRPFILKAGQHVARRPAHIPYWVV